MDTIQLNNRTIMPLLGLGVFQITDQELCEQTVLHALHTGYRMIDTAAGYGNEKAVGNAIKNSEVAREEIFISSKVWIQDAGYERTMKSFEKNLQNLQTDYLDLYLIHMPYGDYHGSWRAMEELHRSGKVKAIGVCNFLEDRLVDLILSHDIIPAVNQMEMHPFCQQTEIRTVMEKYNIKMMAWAPFAEGNKGIFTNQTLSEIGATYGKTPAQVILKWLRQHNVIAIPKSVRLERIEENFNVDDFELSNEEISRIEELDQKESLILDIQSLDEVYRLHSIKFKQ